MSKLWNRLGTGSDPRLYLKQGNSNPTGTAEINYGLSGDFPTDSGNWSTWDVKDDADPINNYYGTITLEQDHFKGGSSSTAYQKPGGGYYLDKEALTLTTESAGNYQLNCNKIHRPPPPTLPNWSNGQENQDSNPTPGKKFWVADYGADKWVSVASDTSIAQSTDGPYLGSRAYPIRIDTGNPDWHVSGGNGAVAKDGLWQIEMSIGSNGDGPWCETFYLAERLNFTPHYKDYYIDGDGGGSIDDYKTKKVHTWFDRYYPNKNEKGEIISCGKTGAYSREIDIMETRWHPSGPQINLPMWGDTGWTSRRPAEVVGAGGKKFETAVPDAPDYGLKNKLKDNNASGGDWKDGRGVAGVDFIIFGCLIRGDSLWLYAYKGVTYNHVQWYCTKEVNRTNKTYNQTGPLVPYIGTWTDQKNAGNFSTRYRNFIYLAQGDSKIAGKNPQDHPEAFGLALYPPDWQLIPGSLSNVSAAADGTVWGANT
jgi:hypothetical protein